MPRLLRNRYATLHAAVLEHLPAHHLRACQETRLHDDAVCGIAVQGGFDQCEVEVQAAVALDEVHDVLDPFPNAVAHDQEQELASFEMAADVVDEVRLLEVGRLGASEVVQDVALASERPRNLPLQVLVCPGRELLGVVEDLPDDLAPRLWISPELVLGKDQSS